MSMSQDKSEEILYSIPILFFYHSKHNASRLHSEQSLCQSKERGDLCITLQIECPLERPYQYPSSMGELKTPPSGNLPPSLNPMSTSGSTKPNSIGNIGPLSIGLWDTRSHRLLTSIPTCWNVEWNNVEHNTQKDNLSSDHIQEISRSWLDYTKSKLPLQQIKHWKFKKFLPAGQAHSQSSQVIPEWLTLLNFQIRHTHWESPSSMLPYTSDFALGNGCSCKFLAEELSTMVNAHISTIDPNIPSALDQIHTHLTLLCMATHTVADTETCQIENQQSINKTDQFSLILTVPSLLQQLNHTVKSSDSIPSHQLYRLYTLALSLLSAIHFGHTAKGPLIQFLKTSIHWDENINAQARIAEFLGDASSIIGNQIDKSDELCRLACQFVQISGINQPIGQIDWTRYVSVLPSRFPCVHYTIDNSHITLLRTPTR